MQKLLAAGGDKETLDNDEMTPVMWACYFDNCENVEALLNISTEDEMRYEIIDAEIQDKDVNGKCLLHWSVARASSKQCFKVPLLFCRLELISTSKIILRVEIGKKFSRIDSENIRRGFIDGFSLIIFLVTILE